MELTSKHLSVHLKENAEYSKKSSKVKIVDGRPVIGEGIPLYSGGLMYMAVSGEIYIGGYGGVKPYHIVTPGINLEQITHPFTKINIDYTSGVKQFGTIGQASYFILMNDGRLYTWGGNGSGHLGIGKVSDYEIRIHLVTGSWDKIVVPNSGKHRVNFSAMYLRAKGTDDWYLSGRNYNNSSSPGMSLDRDVTVPTKIDPPKGEVICDMFIGGNLAPSVFALCKSGKMYGAGRNYYGASGIAAASEYYGIWKQCVGLPEDISVDDVYFYGSCGYDTTADISNGTSTFFLISGNIYAAGHNYYNQLGLAGVTTAYEFMQLELPKVKKFIHGYVAMHPSAAITEDDDLYMWGFQGNMAIPGSGTSVPVPTLIKSGVKNFWPRHNSAKNAHFGACVIQLDNNEVELCGRYMYGSMYLRDSLIATNNMYDTLMPTSWGEWQRVNESEILFMAPVSEIGATYNERMYVINDKGELWAIGRGTGISGPLYIKKHNLNDGRFMNPIRLA